MTLRSRKANCIQATKYFVAASSVHAKMSLDRLMLAVELQRHK